MDRQGWTITLMATRWALPACEKRAAKTSGPTFETLALSILLPRFSFLSYLVGVRDG